MQSSSKILIVTSYFAPAWAYGGPPRVLFDYARGLQNLGHEVAVYTTDVFDENRYNGPATETIDGIYIHRFKNLSNRLAWKKKRFLPLGYRKHLRNSLSDYDFVLMADVRILQNFFTYKECLRRKTPYALASFGSLPSRKRFLKYMCDTFFSDHMISKAAWLFAQTEHEEAEYKKHGGSDAQIRLIPLPVDMAGSSFKERQTDKLRLAFVGRIHHLKGLQNIVEALGLIGDNLDFEMKIVGRDDGYLKEILGLIKKHGLSDRIIFCGPKYGQEKVEILRQSNLFAITPLNYEETSTAALEAAATGCALMITRQTDVPYLQEYNAGVVVGNTVEEIRLSLLGFAGNLASLADMGKNARRLIEEKYELNKVARLIDNCIKG